MNAGLAHDCPVSLSIPGLILNLKKPHIQTPFTSTATESYFLSPDGMVYSLKDRPTQALETGSAFFAQRIPRPQIPEHMFALSADVHIYCELHAL